MIVERKLFASGNELAIGLASDVTGTLSQALARRGEARLAVSGGNTPKAFFHRLSRSKLDWRNVTVTLVDERCVPESDERSNARLVVEHLLQSHAAVARFVPLFGRDGAEKLGRFDAVILGMGMDGHTASFFPAGDNLAAALDPGTPQRLVSMSAPGAAEDRITFTLPVLLDSDFIALHIEGTEKLDVLHRAEQSGPVADMPIRAFLRAREKLRLYWCP